jgi:integrase
LTLITLNPPGRAQTKKYRPVVRMPPTLKTLLRAAYETRQGEHVIMFRGRHVHRLDTGWDKAVVAAKLDKRVTLYSLRHTVARHLRSEGVDAWSVASQLGHKRPGFEMSERYTANDPAYQREATAALEKLLVFLCPDAFAFRLATARDPPWFKRPEKGRYLRYFRPPP